MTLPRHAALPLAVAAALALGSCVQHVGGPDGPDRASVEGRLLEIGVAWADVDHIEYTVDRANEGGVINRWAWAKMKTCDGYIVVRTTGGLGRSGSEPYATGNCRLPEPKS